MKKQCGTCDYHDEAGDCLNIVAVSTLIRFKTSRFLEVVKKRGCSEWQARTPGTCGECRWWDWEGNQNEAVWISRFESDESRKQELEEAKHKGACLVTAPKGVYWFPATSELQRGCGDFDPKPDEVEK